MNREADKSGAVHDREGSPGLKHQTTMKHYKAKIAQAIRKYANSECS